MSVINFDSNKKEQNPFWNFLSRQIARWRALCWHFIVVRVAANDSHTCASFHFVFFYLLSCTCSCFSFVFFQLFPNLCCILDCIYISYVDNGTPEMFINKHKCCLSMMIAIITWYNHHHYNHDDYIWDDDHMFADTSEPHAW